MLHSGPCPIWGGGKEIKRTLDWTEIDNRRCGGRYRISDLAAALVQKPEHAQLPAKLTTWIIDQHRHGDQSPLIDRDVITKISESRRLKTSEQIQRFFLLAAWRDMRPSDCFKISGQVDERYKDDIADLCAWIELDDGQISEFMRLLDELGYARHNQNLVHLTAKGFQKLEEIQTRNANSQQAFVAMWFDQSMEDAFDNGFEKAIIDAGFSAMRIDRKQHNNKIDDEIIAEIRRSRFIVADFTCGKTSTVSVPRGGVYFEAGFAIGLGIPVIWCCREDSINDVHFDTRQFAHILWSSRTDLRKSLYNRIAAVIGTRSN